MVELRDASIKKRRPQKVYLAESPTVYRLYMIDLGQVPILGFVVNKISGAISYIRKYLSLREKEGILNKKEEAIIEREKKVDWLERIENDNRTRVTQLVETKLIDLNPGLTAPRLRFTLEFINSSIFNLKINEITYNVRCNVGSTRSIHVLENEFYPKELDLLRQGKSQLSSTKDIPQGIAQMIIEEARRNPAGEMEWVFTLMYHLSSEKHHILSTAGSAPTKSVQNEWIIRTTRQ